MRAVIALFKLWSINDESASQLVGAPDIATYTTWKGGSVSLPPEMHMTRLLDLIAIYRGLAILFPDRDRAHGWPRKPNEAFGGHSALEKMLEGDDEIRAVRAYIEAEIHG